VQRKAARRLPKTIKPEFYDVTLKPNLALGTFTGSETINIVVEQPAKEIWLHAVELKISSAQLVDDKNKVLPLRLGGDTREELVSFTPAQELKPGKYKLRTTFSGVMSDKLRGLYKAKFTDRAGKQRMIATTQMEPADARRMIPVFDEPDMKARFKLTVHTLPQFTAISNAPMVKSTMRNNQKIVEFAPTEPMSSYLLALVVGELESTPEVIVQGTPIRVWAVKGMAHLGTFSRDAAAKLLPYMNSYFGINYPWKKLDLIAVPDFAAGAMENPGAITFRETLLLVDPKTAATGSQKAAVSVIAHEMAHMWFGDLVTMKWWDDLWLNEAFATWMATKAVDAVRPDWQMWKEFAYDRTAALHTDALRSTRSIQFEVRSPEQTHEMFDVITYEKGASVLRMLERHVGEPVFQKGVHTYLKSHEFSNATTTDLWDAIGAVAGMPCSNMMASWVHQPGYPLITIDESKREGSVSATQKRFFLLEDGTPSTDKWSVPIGVRVVNRPADQNKQSDADRKFLMVDQTAEVPLLNPADPAANPSGLPFIANAGGVGYFRVRYAEPIFNRLLEQPRENFDPSERLSLVDDSSELMLAGAVPVSQYLDLISRYKGETDEAVWGSIVSDLHYFDRFVDDSNRASYQRFVRAQLGEVFGRLGWEPKPNESAQIRQLRAQIIGTLGTSGQDASIIAEARTRFAKYLKTPSSLDRDLISPVSNIVAYNGSTADYDKFRELYRTASTPEQRARNLHVLDNFRAPELVSRTLELSLSKQVRLQDAPHLMGGLLRNRQTEQQAWKFITENWQRMGAIFPEDMVPGVVSSASNFNRESQLSDLKLFLAKHPVPSGKSTVARTIERVSANVQFRKRSADDLNRWLQSHYGS
jgi:puromycin-sensitive aminopeptidase